MGQIISDIATYARVVNMMRIRSAAAECDFPPFFSAEVGAEHNQADTIFMTTEISNKDVQNISFLCAQAIDLTEYCASLYEYPNSRMIGIVPNLDAMIEDLAGARLLPRPGFLLNLATYPAFTAYISRFEKILFHAVKRIHSTPKYGLLFLASVFAQASINHKRKSCKYIPKDAFSIYANARGEPAEDATVGEYERIAVGNRFGQVER